MTPDLIHNLLVVVGSYALVVLGSFAWEVISAPAILDDEQQKEIGDLKERAITLAAGKQAIDAEREQEVRDWLNAYNDEEKDVLRWLLKQGEREIEVDEIFSGCKISRDAINNTLTKGRHHTLLVNRLDTTKTKSYWQINPGYREALLNYLFPKNQ